LAKHFWLLRRDACTYNHAALRAACGGGHLELAQWLVDVFAYDPADVRTNQNCVFRGACARGQLAAAQWLVQRFRLGPEDVNDCEGAALRRACADAHVATVQWLAPQCRDPAIRRRALRAARKRGHGVVIYHILSRE
jgi:hypothetical protein